MKKTAIVLMLMAMPLMAEELKLGKPIDVTSATEIHELLAKPDAYIGKTVRIEGTVTGVCEDMGCWIKVRDAESGETLQVKVKDGEIVFPKDAVGKKAVAQGTFTRLPPNKDGKSTYQVKGQGAIIR
jgi:hypothetical protein